MGLYIFIAIIIAVGISFVTYLHGRKAWEKKREGKWVKCGIATVETALGAALVLNLLYQCAFCDSCNDMLNHDISSLFSGTVLMWFALPYLKTNAKRLLLFFSPAPLYFFLFLFLMASAFGVDFPLSKSEVRFTEQAEIDSLLDVTDLPALEFDGAANSSYGNKVNMRLVDAADSTRLMSIYERIKAERPLQFMDIDYYGQIYTTVDNEQEDFVNVVFDNRGLTIVYGSIWGRKSRNKCLFDSIQAPLPEYKFVTFVGLQYGPDWIQDERIEFSEPVSLEWLETVRQAADTSEFWEYEETPEAYKISFNNGSINNGVPRVFTNMTLYKNMYGKRKIADINWGDY